MHWLSTHHNSCSGLHAILKLVTAQLDDAEFQLTPEPIIFLLAIFLLFFKKS